MYNSLLTKKDIIALNQEIGEKGELSNEGSLEFALNIARSKRNWLYELAYLTRSLLVDHVFIDGNKRTCLIMIIYYFEINKKKCNKNKLLFVMRKIAKNNITDPIKITRLLHNVIR